MFCGLCVGSTDTLEDGLDEPKADTRNPSSPERQIQHRANTTMHVCWHRNTSVSMRDQNVAVEVCIVTGNIYTASY